MKPRKNPRRIHPAGWPRARGYSNGVAARGEVLAIAGQIAWNQAGQIVSDSLVAQFDQALANVLEVLRTAGGRPEDLISLTVFVTDLAEYRAGVAELGRLWRARAGRNYPAMALVGVAGLVEPGAKVELSALAVLPA